MMNHLGVLSSAARIVSRATNDPSCPSGKRASVQDDAQRRCIGQSTVSHTAPPADYTPPGVDPTYYATESKTGLYVGIGVGAVVLIGGAYLLFGRS